MNTKTFVETVYGFNVEASKLFKSITKNYWDVEFCEKKLSSMNKLLVWTERLIGLAEGSRVSKAEIKEARDNLETAKKVAEGVKAAISGFQVSRLMGYAFSEKDYNTTIKSVFD